MSKGLSLHGSRSMARSSVQRLLTNPLSFFSCPSVRDSRQRTSCSGTKLALGNKFETNSSLFPHPTREPVLGGPGSRRQFVRTAHHFVPCFHKCTTTNDGKKDSLDDNPGVHGTLGPQGKTRPNSCGVDGARRNSRCHFRIRSERSTFHPSRQDT
jgi:hypothetical protein